MKEHITVVHWVEDLAKWIAGFAVRELTRPLWPSALTWTKEWLRRAWIVFLGDKMLGSLGLHQWETPRGTAFGLTFSPCPAGMEMEGRNLASRRFDSVERLAEWCVASLPVSFRDSIVDAFGRLGSSTSASIPNVCFSRDEIKRHGLESTIRSKGRIR
jgi:hypothetical protein